MSWQRQRPAAYRNSALSLLPTTIQGSNEYSIIFKKKGFKLILKIRLKGNGGKIAVIGSVHIFSDNYLDKEDNKRWLEDLVEYLTDTKATILDFDRDVDVFKNKNGYDITFLLTSVI